MEACHFRVEEVVAAAVTSETAERWNWTVVRLSGTAGFVLH